MACQSIFPKIKMFGKVGRVYKTFCELANFRLQHFSGSEQFLRPLGNTCSLPQFDGSPDSGIAVQKTQA